MIILPAIDILDQKAQMLYQGDYSKGRVVGADPLAIAKSFEEAGASWLHMVDLNGAKEGQRVNSDIIKTIVESTGLKVEIGGGIRNMESVDYYLSLGATRVIIGSAAVKDPAFLKEAVEKYEDMIAVGVDIRDGFVYVNGWLESTDLRYDKFLENLVDLGLKTVIITDISKDGALEGANYDLYKEIAQAYKIDLIASGGITDLEEVKKLSDLGIYGCIIGSAIYNGNIDLEKALQI